MNHIYLISYFYKPNKSVGVLRISYWFDRLLALKIPVTLITAEPGNSELNVVRIPVKTLSFTSRLFHDASYDWGKKVLAYFDTEITLRDGDTVLITGGPFLQFQPLLSIKKRFPQVNVIADYRDPLTHNPRHRKNLLRKFVKLLLELNINKTVDSIITVNHVCERLLVGSSSSCVIDNGYDERCYKNVNSEGRRKNKQMIYAGKFYEETNYEKMLDYLLHVCPDFEMFYIGNTKLINASNRIIKKGVLSYTETAEYINMAEIGLVMTHGDSFESTTKLFDYIGGKLKILIITEGQVKTGNIHELTKNNPNVEWATNDLFSIKEALEKLFARSYQEWESTKYSREYGFELLKQLLNIEV